MSTSFCVSYAIDYLLGTNDHDLLTAVSGKNEDGTPATPDQLRRWLRYLKKEGQEQLVIGECDNQDDKGWCKGHPGEGEAGK